MPLLGTSCTPALRAPGETRPTIVGGGCDIEKKQAARTQPYREDEPFKVENARPLGYDP